MTETYCDACDGDGVRLLMGGYRVTSGGDFNCGQIERVVECEECGGLGYIEEDEEE